MDIRTQVSLALYTTLGVGGPAQFFCTALTEQDIVDALAFARDRNLPVFVLGGGSNLLVGDAGFPGLVLRIALRGIHLEGGRVQASAGEPWDAFARSIAEQGLAGIECLVGIPGTVGGTPVQNVGAYGQEVSSTITLVRAYDTVEQRFVEIENKDCAFAYRTSLFNTTAAGRYIVSRVDFHLQPGGNASLKYAELAKRFADAPPPTLAEVAAAVLTIRAGKGMVTAAPLADGTYPQNRAPDTVSAGSFFRNPVVSQAVFENVAAAAGLATDAVPHWPAAGGIKLPAAWLIEKAGVQKGESLGRAAISSLHTLALVNRGGATAAEVQRLRDDVAARVFKTFGVSLEQEPVSVGQ